MQWSAHLQWQSRAWPCGSVHLEGSRSFDGLDADGPWSKCFLRASASHLSDRRFDWRLDIRNYLPASRVPWLTDPASECEMKKHSTTIQCSDFQLRNLYPKLEMYWEPEVFNHCKCLSKVLLCCVHKLRRWPCASPSDLNALHFAAVILRFNFWPGPRAEI